jgi:hypothetical protein
VIYPFGYGLSYTEFDWEVTGTPGAITKDGDIEFTVTVTNTGDLPGKDVVQLYYSAPYTLGGIEKSHVVLGAFEKTEMLDPGGSETLTITMPVKTMASWDQSFNAGWYVLEPGHYSFYLAKGYEGSNAWARGAEADGRTHTLLLTEEIIYRDAPTGHAYENVFLEETMFMAGTLRDGTINSDGTSSGTLIHDPNKIHANGLVMSREDFGGTFPRLLNSEFQDGGGIARTQRYMHGSSAWMGGLNTSTATDTAGPADGIGFRGMPWHQRRPWVTSVMPTAATQNGVMLGDLYGLDWDDPL